MEWELSSSICWKQVARLESISQLGFWKNQKNNFRLGANLFIMKQRQPPIPFDSLIDYYSHEETLRRPKDELEREIRDLVTITDFLLNKIPIRIKRVKNKIKDYNDNLNAVIQDVNRAISELLPPPQQPNKNPICNIGLAYETLKLVSLYEEEDNEFEGQIDEESIVLRQLKFKFLQSQNIPSKAKGWSILYKNNDNRLHLTHKKYQAILGLALDPATKQYVWNLNSIQDTFMQKRLLVQEDYFENVIRPEIKKRHPEAYEENIVASLYRFLSFIELIELQTLLKAQPGSRVAPDDQKIIYSEEDFELEFEFTKPENSDFVSYFTVTNKKGKQFSLKLLYQQQAISGYISYSDMNLDLCEGFEHLGPQQIINMMWDLRQIVDSYDKFKNMVSSKTFYLIKDNIFWKWNNYHWYVKTEKYHPYSEGGNGVYLAEPVHTDIVVIRITQNGYFDSNYAPHSYIANLLTLVPDIKIFFIYLHLIRVFANDNDGEGCELDDFGINEQGVWFDFKQKVVYEDSLVRMTRGNNEDDKSPFTTMCCIIQFDFAFRQVRHLVAHLGNQIRDPSPASPTSYSSQKWIKYMKEKPAEKRLDLSHVIEFVFGVRRHYLVKRVYEKRLQQPNRALFGLLF